jgi:hypothetical protein
LLSKKTREINIRVMFHQVWWYTPVIPHLGGSGSRMENFETLTQEQNLQTNKQTKKSYVDLKDIFFRVLQMPWMAYLFLIVSFSLIS